MLAAASVPVTVTFSDGASLEEQGQIQQISLSLGFNSDTLKPWLHELTLAQTMTVTPANQAFSSVTISLAGTTPAITAMSECIKAHYIQNVPPPFTSVSQQVPEQSAASPAQAAVPGGRAHISDDLRRLACYDRAQPPFKGESQNTAASNGPIDKTGRGSVICVER